MTTTTLASVPDVPFTRFSLTLPEKEYSALAGNGNLCAKKLVMPVRFVGQNGKTLDQNTKVKVTGCAAARKKHRGTHAKKHKGKHGKHHVKHGKGSR